VLLCLRAHKNYFSNWKSNVLEVRGETVSKIKKVTVLGAGVMGHGIAQIASQAGKFEVTMFARTTLDRGFAMISKSLELFEMKKTLTKAEKREILGRIHGTSDLRKAVLDADLVIESIPEKLEEKSALFKKIDEYISPEVIVATNTSSLNITTLSSFLSHQERFCGMHFFNPAQLMKLVEVTKGKKTSDKTIWAIMDVAHKMGKETVLIKKDSPGFIVNRIIIPALNEAAAICWTGVADRDDIDKAIKLGLNWPMGPLMLIDYIGVDTVLEIAKNLEAESSGLLHPSQGLEQLVKANQLGRKTGKGYYEWTERKNPIS
jgi:3-hydroxybutyryl-CoA dehydrogenase